MATINMNRCIFIFAVSSCISCALVSAQQIIQDDALIAPITAEEQSNSRLLRRRTEKAHHKQASVSNEQRQLQNEILDLNFDFNAWQSPCASILAVGGFKRHLHDGSNSSSTSFHSTSFPADDNLQYETMDGNNTLLSYKNDDVDTDEEFMCEKDDGTLIPVHATDEQLSELRTLLNHGQMVSGESTVEVEQIDKQRTTDDESLAFIEDTTDIMGPEEFVSLPPGPISVVSNEGTNDDWRQRRRLNKYSGEKKILVVRVTDQEGRAVPENAEFISDKFFGTYGDEVTVASGFDACSFGEFTITSDYGSQFKDNLFSAPGVIEVDIDLKLRTSTQPAIVSAARRATAKKLGVNLPGPFDHIVFIVESCYQVGTSCGFAAYAVS